MRIYGVVSWTAAICVFAIALPAQAGQDANFVLYNHYMEEKGETEISIYSDYGRVGKGEPNYTAQLLEIEYGVTSLWTSSVYFEFAKTFGDGEKYDFASFRWENRYKLFKNETFLNPVLYGELEIKKPNSRFLRSVVGRTDGGEEGEGEIEHEIETKLILSHDFSSNFNVAFNTIQELKLDNGVWSFGYVGGVNYVVYRAFDSASVADLGGFGLNKLTVGLEMYGGLGDSVKGLTLSAGKTEQYLGVNLRADLKNDFHVGVGGAFGVTEHSQDAIIRVKAGYEFE